MGNETQRPNEYVLAPEQAQRTIVVPTLAANRPKPKFSDLFQGQKAIEIKIDSLSDWRKLIFTMDEQASTESDLKGHHRFPRKWVFRGQANANWKIRSSLEVITPKELLKNPNAEQIIHEKELQSFLRFRRYGHPYIEPLDLNVVEWFAYMQHFGIKTRLVDFTESPYTALYFLKKT